MIKLPRPISVNSIYANVTGKGRVKSAKYNTWMRHVDALMWEQRCPRYIGPVRLHFRVGEVGASPKMDGDNTLKAYIDALVKYDIIEEDNRKIVRAISMEWVPELDGAEAEIWPVDLEGSK